MGKFLAKMERKWGKYAIRNLPLYLIICYAFGYLIQVAMPEWVSYLRLDVVEILHGEVWRIVSWVLIPPPIGSNFNSGAIFVVALMMFVYYSIASTLEQVWGTFMLNVYLFSGVILTVIGAFIIFGISYGIYGERALLFGDGSIMLLSTFISKAMALTFSTYYINMTIFLAYAATFPEVEMRLMFLIPVKAKWLGLVYGIILVDEVYRISTQGHWVMGAAIVCSLLNFLIFFLITRKHIGLNKQQRQVRKNFKQATGGGGHFGGGFGSGVSRSSTSSSRPTQRTTQIKSQTSMVHKCAVCGQTSETAPELSFRYCTKCEGSYEYCENHIFTHQHVKRS